MILIERVEVGSSRCASIGGISELTVNIQPKRLAKKLPKLQGDSLDMETSTGRRIE